MVAVFSGTAPYALLPICLQILGLYYLSGRA